jgi:putative ABC transport system substrate-binding protein
MRTLTTVAAAFLVLLAAPGPAEAQRYGTNIPEQYRQAATFVDKILRGARPADLPIEQPTKFDLAINLGAARSLGLTVPSSMLLRADQVVQ